MAEQVYIHYGHKAFSINEFMPVSNWRLRNKPMGGLWASPLDAERGWKNWCEAEEFAECDEKNSFRFRLARGAKVYHIRNKKDVDALPEQKERLEFVRSVDFEKMMKDGWQAIELHLSECPELYWALYGWDCDCILVLDPNVVEVC